MRSPARILLFVTLFSSAACAKPGAGVALPRAAQQEAAMSPAFFATAVNHLARDARGRVLVDPRSLRPGADLRRIDTEDLEPGATAVTQLRTRVLAERGITPTDAMVDQRCTFSAGVGLLPGREAMLPDSLRRQAAECGAREAYTTFILTTPEPVRAGEYPAGTWSIRVHAMERGGFSIWELYLHAAQVEQWEVVGSERQFVIWS